METRWFHKPKKRSHRVVGSNPTSVTRRISGGIGIHRGLKIPWSFRHCEFDSRLVHNIICPYSSAGRAVDC